MRECKRLHVGGLVAKHISVSSPGQLVNASMPIDKTEFGIVMDVSLGQPKNAAILIFVTELGMMVFLQPVISLFVAVSMIALQLSLESYLLLFGATARLASFEHPEKIPLPMVVTECGIMTEVSPEHSEKALSPIAVMELGIVMDSSPEHPEKTDLSIAVTSFGIVMDFRLKQRKKAFSPIAVTELGIVMDSSLEHPKKAHSPIVVTNSGIVMDIREQQPKNASSPIVVMVLGMMVRQQPAINLFVFVSMIALQSSLASYFLLFGATVRLVSPEHLEKTPLPIVVTESGIVTDVSPEHPEKAPSPIVVTESGIVMDPSTEQSLKA